MADEQRKTDLLDKLGLSDLEMEVAIGLVGVLTGAAVTALTEMQTYALPPTFRRTLVIEGAFAEALAGLIEISGNAKGPTPPS